VGIDNELYDRHSDSWWDENGFLNLLRVAMNPPRFGYFKEVLTGALHIDPRGKTALDVGCGGGLLAEEFAAIGCVVTGVDPSRASLKAARSHAEPQDLDVCYLAAAGEQIPFHDASFDIVYCCDVLEHVADLDRVISEISRVLRPEGVFFFDTINRTLKSRLVAIKVWQDWKWSRIVPPNLHVWEMFIRPCELKDIMRSCGMAAAEFVGISPEAGPGKMLGLLIKRKKGIISQAEMARGVKLVKSRDLSISYMGYARKGSKR